MKTLLMVVTAALLIVVSGPSFASEDDYDDGYEDGYEDGLAGDVEWGDKKDYTDGYEEGQLRRALEAEWEKARKQREKEWDQDTE